MRFVVLLLVLLIGVCLTCVFVCILFVCVFVVVIAFCYLLGFSWFVGVAGCLFAGCFCLWFAYVIGGMFCELWFCVISLVYLVTLDWFNCLVVVCYIVFGCSDLFGFVWMLDCLFCITDCCIWVGLWFLF